MKTRWIWLALFAAFAWSCAVTEGGRAPSAGHDRAATDPVPVPREAEEARATHVAVLDPADLDGLEARGFRLSQVVLGKDAATTEELDKTSFASVFDVLRADVESTRAEHPTARVTSVLGTRLFDVRWLRSKEMRFELIGVFNRLDRRAFYTASCGEVRFLYRLAYTTQQGGAEMSGRLPLTVNVVFLLPEDDGCERQARAWRAPPDLEGDALMSWLTTDGALAPAKRKEWQLKAVETNLQTVRIQSSAHPTMGGHVEYAMRVFHPAGGAPASFAPAGMDNTPNVAALRKDAGLRDALLAYLRDPAVLRAIDDGTVRIPDRFVATSARSIAPRGLSREANRPFSQVLTDDDFARSDLSAYRTIRTPKALLRRLDGLSCVGCHQSRSIAGFHHVGHDAPTDPAWSSLVSGASAHLLADLERRTRYVDALASEQTPDEARPSAERQGNEGGFGAPCGLYDRGFFDWTCAEGLSCLELEDSDVGVCLEHAVAGAPCETGGVVPGPTPRKDFVKDLSKRACETGLGCSRNIQGFPLGACAGRCTDVGPDETCIDFVDIDGLQACFLHGKSEAACASQYVVERVDRACDRAHPCRQDFVCARTDDPDRGACVPPYFVFPLRADGYPIAFEGRAAPDME